jgi:hypothetical protein
MKKPMADLMEHRKPPNDQWGLSRDDYAIERSVQDAANLSGRARSAYVRNYFFRLIEPYWHVTRYEEFRSER